jgi:DNA-binding transcriptional LysR family regulator
LVQLRVAKLHQSIKSLEDDLGKLLFDRVGKRIELTTLWQRGP